jgi:hypothetical protein
MSANLEQHAGRLLVGGELKKSELDTVQSQFAQKIAAIGTVKLLVLLKNFAGWPRRTDWGDTDFFFSHRNDFEKIAVVGRPRWEAQVLAFTGAGLRKGPVKFVPETGGPEARVACRARAERMNQTTDVPLRQNPEVVDLPIGSRGLRFAAGASADRSVLTTLRIFAPL